MKNIKKITAVFLLLCTAFVSCKKETPTGKTQTATLAIEGMTCAVGCAKTIERKLAKLEGVNQASVDFENKTATVEFDENKQNVASLTQTIEAVAGGGLYKVSNAGLKE